jgi:hypothetical protein
MMDTIWVCHIDLHNLELHATYHLIKRWKQNTSNEEPMNKKSFQNYLTKLVLNYFSYFNSKATEHVITNKTC